MIELSKYQRRDSYDYEQLYKDLRAQGIEAREIPKPEPSCPVCDDLKWVTRSVPVGHPDFGKSFPCPRCNEAKVIQGRVERMLKDVPRLERYADTSYESFVSRCGGDLEGKQLAYEVSRTVAAGELPIDTYGYAYHGVLMTGPYGVGKTGLAALALFERLRAGDSAGCIDWLHFANTIQNTYAAKKRDEGKDAPTKLEMLHSIIELNVLLIDELGHLDQKHNPIIETPDRCQILQLLIAGRHARQIGITMVTTNLSVDELRVAFGEYTVQRLLELCLLVEIGGKSIRNQQGQ